MSLIEVIAHSMEIVCEINIIRKSRAMAEFRVYSIEFCQSTLSDSIKVIVQIELIYSTDSVGSVRYMNETGNNQRERELVKLN
jgi:hypothetical protein